MENDKDIQDTSSLDIFRTFIKEGNDLTCNLPDASEVLSRECYETWVSKRKISAHKPEEAFRKVLTAHVRGSEGRKAFEENEEISLLKELRKKRVWPCFENCCSKIGVNGFRALGFHESRKKVRRNSFSDDGNSQDGDLDNQSCGSFAKENCAVKEVDPSAWKYVSSYEVFIKFAVPDSFGRCNILSKDCFETWVKTRRNGTKLPEFSFRKALMAHLSGKDGRRPFPHSIEQLVLQELRKKQTWPCFQDRPEKFIRSIGKKGFRQKGFHELKRGRNEDNNNGNEEEEETEVEDESVLSEDEVAQEKDNNFEVVKRRKLVIPEIYLNCFQGKDTNQLENVFHYDPFEEMMNLFDLNSSQVVHPVSSSPTTFFYENNFQSILRDDVFCAGIVQTSEEKDESLVSPVGPLLNFAFSESAAGSILSTFEDVLETEVLKVIRLRQLSYAVFQKYYNELEHLDLGFPIERFPSDLSGDVRLLRILRTSKGDVEHALSEISALLSWRKEWGIEKIRHELISKNFSVETLKQVFTIGKGGGCYPFFSQDEKGDITDIWILKEQTENDPEEMVKDLYSHIKLHEFKSLVLDRLSYTKRRVVCFKVILDCNIIQDEESEGSGGRRIDWWQTIRTWTWYLKEMSDCGTRWYGGFCSRIHIFGTGFLFRLIFSAVAKPFFSGMNDSIIQSFGRPGDNQSVLREELGESRGSWPTFFGGTCVDPCGNGLAKKELSKFSRK